MENIRQLNICSPFLVPATLQLLWKQQIQMWLWFVYPLLHTSTLKRVTYLSRTSIKYSQYYTPFWHSHWWNCCLHTLEQYESSTENIEKIFNWRSGDYSLSLKKLFLFRKRVEEQRNRRCKQPQYFTSAKSANTEKEVVNRNRYSSWRDSCRIWNKLQANN